MGSTMRFAKPMLLCVQCKMLLNSRDSEKFAMNNCREIERQDFLSVASLFGFKMGNYSNNLPGF